MPSHSKSRRGVATHRMAEEALPLDELLDLRQRPWLLPQELVAREQKDLQAVA